MSTKPLSQEAMDKLRKMTEWTALLVAMQSGFPISYPSFSVYFNCAFPS